MVIPDSKYCQVSRGLTRRPLGNTTQSLRPRSGNIFSTDCLTKLVRSSTIQEASCSPPKSLQTASTTPVKVSKKSC